MNQSWNDIIELQNTRAALVKLLEKIDGLDGLLCSDFDFVKNWGEEIDDLMEEVNKAKRLINHYK